jgi:hypothetical protein
MTASGEAKAVTHPQPDDIISSNLSHHLGCGILLPFLISLQ